MSIVDTVLLCAVMIYFSSKKFSWYPP